MLIRVICQLQRVLMKDTSIDKYTPVEFYNIIYSLEMLYMKYSKIIIISDSNRDQAEKYFSRLGMNSVIDWEASYFDQQYSWTQIVNIYPLIIYLDTDQNTINQYLAIASKNISYIHIPNWLGAVLLSV